MKIKTGNIILALMAIFTIITLTTCTSLGGSAKKSGTDGPYVTVDLRVRGVDITDETINSIYNNLSKNLKEGLSIALIPVYPSPGADRATAAFITDLLDARFDPVKYNMITREYINVAIQEQNFQVLNVNNDTAVQLGKILGADVVIIGTVDGREVNQRIVMRALEVSTGRILAMFMEQFERERGFSEIVVSAEQFDRNIRLTSREYSIRTEVIRLAKDSETIFKVPNGRWEMTCDFSSTPTSQKRPSPLVVDLMEDTRLYVKAHRPSRSDYDAAEEVRRESIHAAAQASAGRITFAKEAAQKLANELQGKIPARAGTAFFPLTNRGIGADDGNFFFDVMSIELANSGQMNIIEKQKLAALLDEYDFQMSGMAGVRTIGQLLGADVVIFGTAWENAIDLIAVDVARFNTLAFVSHFQ
ncbi:MAG: CsgG/HfaB family protein [Treponema sp.]|nr:CsgG/HfaB family protein [Treponema sp.]